VDICLIRCKSPFLIDEKVFPPLGLMSVGTTLKANGHNVEITDTFKPGFKYYGLGPSTPEYPDAVKNLRSIKEHNPDARVVIGGPHASVESKSSLVDGFDGVVVGDGEDTAEEVFSSKKRIVYSSNKAIDKYPLIDRSILEIGEYKYYINGKLATTIMTSKGCPYRCAFCFNESLPVRFQSVGNVIEEIRTLHDEFGYRALMFFDDTFIIQKKRVYAISKCLKELGITWRCFVRGDLVVKHGRELLEIMRESGCVEVGLGVESGSDQILRIINKGETVSDIREAINIIHDVGIRIKGFFIVGLPGESNQTIRETRNFIKDAPFSNVDFTVFVPYPGCRIWRNKKDYDISWNGTGWDSMFYKGKPGEYKQFVRTSALGFGTIIGIRDELEKNFRTLSNHTCEA